MFGLNITELLVGALSFMGALTGAYFYGHSNGVDSERVVWQAKEIKDAQKADKALGAANKLAADATAKYAVIQQQMEVLQNANQTLVDNARRKLSVKRLRDPYSLASSCGQLPRTPTASGNPVINPAPGELSAELDQFLKQQAYEADTVAVYANTCHSWVMGLQGVKP